MQLLARSTVVATAEELLQPDIRDDEKVAAAHFLELEFGHSGAAIFPTDRDDGPGKTAHDGFEWQLYCQIEVGRNERSAAFDHLAPIGLEGVGRVVKRNVEDNADEKVHH